MRLINLEKSKYFFFFHNYKNLKHKILATKLQKKINFKMFLKYFSY